MSPLLLKLCAALSLFTMLAVFELVTRLSDRAKIKSGEAEDMRKDNTMLKRYNAVPHPRWRYWSEGLLVIGCGIAAVLAMSSVSKYQAYGAFYDDSWRMPDVEEHMLYKADGTEALQALYDADPENFDFSGYKICLVKLGCPDCERVSETINALDDSFYVVFSTSPVGKAIVEQYGVTYVPSVLYSGTVLEMRTSDAVPQAPAGGASGENPGTSGNAGGTGDIDGMVGDLMDGLAGEGDDTPKDGPPGTKSGDEIWYQEHGGDAGNQD